jgi:hypothetical protein
VFVLKDGNGLSFISFWKAPCSRNP